jgi:GTPase SAR1 family protein
MVEANKDKDGATSYKVVMLGESGVGKTCIVNRYIKGLYSVTETTIGSNYSSKLETVSSAKVA